jgi:A/G-specific adenine glycosylase
MATATDRSRTKRVASTQFTAAQKRALQLKLLAWYSKHARELPWRKSRDPYRVWISEVMLQQTQVATVERYFVRFVQAFPNVAALAAADEQEVLRLWEGMGYYRRARQMHAAAQKIVKELGGRFPRTIEELRALPGIGRYTAGAITSIAFDERAPILEANTIRLLSRLIAYRDDPLATTGQRVLWQTAEDILPKANVSQFNQALSEIPRPKARKSYTEVREAAVIVRKNGSVLMRQCGADERWAGLWDFPRFAVEAEGPLFAKDEIVNKLRAQTGVECTPGAVLKTLRHGVTRFRITLDCYAAAYVSGRVRANARWTPLAKLPTLPLNTTGRKLANLARH